MNPNGKIRIRLSTVFHSALALVSVSLFGTLSLFAGTPAGGDSRYTSALDAAAIHETSLAVAPENAFLLGNGDINGLLYAGGPGLQLRITKNDVWDARIDIASDPKLAVIDIRNHTVNGGAPNPPSWVPSYPCPMTCAILGLTSAGAGPAWQPIRAEGRTNTWKYAGHEAVMSIEGKAGQSCGWQTTVAGNKGCERVRLRLSGTPNARYYLDVNNAHGSGWKDTPATEQDVFLDLPAGTVVSQIELYTWTKDGGLAENRCSALELQGAKVSQTVDLQLVTPPPSNYWLDVKRAVATVPGNSTAAPVRIRALADRNVFLIEGDTTVTLNPTTAGFVPMAERGSRDGVEYLVQTLPSDAGYPATGDWPGMSLAVAQATADQRSAVAVVTSLESKHPLDDAIALARSTLAAKANSLDQAHDKGWERFWSASKIDLADTYLRDLWYRNLYFMRCISKEGVEPAGLFAGMVGDFANWHGDFHLNYNSEQTYWSWYSCNHGELSEPYEQLVRSHLPRAQWFAKVTYDCDGAFFPYNMFLHEPPDPAACKSKNGRQVAFNPQTYTLGVAGWAVQNSWLHYLYYPDREQLEAEVYPLLRQVSIFYADFADRCKINADTGKIVFGPTYCPEMWGPGSNDGACDIAFARMTLKAAITSAGLLGVDAGLVKWWRQTLDKIPDYPRTTGASPVVLGVAGVTPPQYNIPVPALPVYPAGEVTWFSPDAEKNLFAHTIDTISVCHANDMVILGGARARLSMPDAYATTRAEFLARQQPNGTLRLMPDLHDGNGFNANGIFTENFAATGVITEMLLQSVNDTIRVFPAWPSTQNAAFENLRAQGGFLVSAEETAGKVTSLEVTSTCGGKMRLLSPWRDIFMDGRKLVPDARNIVEIATATGQKLILSGK